MQSMKAVPALCQDSHAGSLDGHTSARCAADATSPLSQMPSDEGHKSLSLRHEIETLRAALSEAQHAANHDYLTGLLNRRAFDQKAQEWLQDASGPQNIALLWLDLDDFKAINDRGGHGAGDATLQAVAQTLQQACSRSALIARIGGDEFCILESGIDATAAEQLSCLVRRELAALTAPGVSQISISVGIAVAERGSCSLAELRHQADAALYAIKRRGGNGAELHRYAHAEPAAPFRELQPDDLRRAISANELRLFYQPKFAARTKRIEGIEALVRWEHPDQGLLLPKTFLPLAEHGDLIEPLTEWTIRQATLDRAKLGLIGQPLTLAINISGQVLCKPNFARWLHALTDGIAEGIGIEVTETEIIPDSETAIVNLTDCVKMGYRVAIDDYGAGLSSLTYLKKLPAHELKIDRSFISELTKSHRDPLLVRSTIDLAHALGMTVTAEGVEAPAALALLTVMGCDTVQGFLLAKPMPLCRLSQFLKESGAPLQREANSKLALRPARRSSSDVEGCPATCPT